MLREIAAIYRESKKKRDINWFTEWVCRPPAAAVVYLLRDTRVTPNQVTFASLVVAAGAGAMLVCVPGHLGLLLAVLVFELSFVLDCVDGQLARVRKTTSPLGHLYDFLMDELKAMIVLGCVAARLWRESGDELYLVAGLAGLFALAASLAVTSFMRRPEYGAPPPTPDGQPARLVRRSGLFGWALTGLEHGARTVVHYPAYIWIVAAFDRIDVYFWAYAGVHVLYLGYSMASVTFRMVRPGGPGR